MSLFASPRFPFFIMENKYPLFLFINYSSISKNKQTRCDHYFNISHKFHSAILNSLGHSNISNNEITNIKYLISTPSFLLPTITLNSALNFKHLMEIESAWSPLSLQLTNTWTKPKFYTNETWLIGCWVVGRTQT